MGHTIPGVKEPVDVLSAICVGPKLEQSGPIESIPLLGLRRSLVFKFRTKSDWKIMELSEYY